MSADNSSPSLSQRLKWFFGTSPHDIMFTQAMFDFFRDIAAAQPQGTERRAVPRTRSSTDSANAQRQMAGRGDKVAADIRYRGNSPSLSVQCNRSRRRMAM
jgi:branched-chain amino acid transport system substrate-binding protein